MWRAILKATERGQITLPKHWRDLFATSDYSADVFPDKIVLRPLVFSYDASQAPSPSAPLVEPAEELRRLKEELGNAVGFQQFTGLTTDQMMERLEKFYRMQELEQLQDLERWRNMR